MRRFCFKKRNIFFFLLGKLLMGAFVMHFWVTSIAKESLFGQENGLSFYKEEQHFYENDNIDNDYGKSENFKESGVDLEEDGEDDLGKEGKETEREPPRPNRLGILMTHYRKRDDTRPKTCLLRNYSVLHEKNVQSKLENLVSVIIMVNDESESFVYAEVASIARTTDSTFLKEVIIFVYGNANLSKSFLSFWGDLTYEQSLDFDIVLVERRLPITSARNHAVDMTRGDIFVFLHARLETLTTWLEPILFEIAFQNNPKRVAVFAADEIDFKTKTQIEHIPWHLVTVPEWSLVDVQLHELNTEVRNLRKLDPYPDSSPIRTPLFLWSFFAMRKEFYQEIGGYDSAFKTSYSRSGEDVDFASRVWRCGGDIYFIPCSKVAQSNQRLKEDEAKRSEDMNYNMMLMAHNYNLEDHEMFLLWNQNFEREITPNVTDIAKLEKTCPDMKSFSWFLEKMVPEMWKKDQLWALGTIKVSDSNFCIDSYHGFEPRLYSCHGFSSQRFMYLKGRLQIQNVLRKCLEPSDQDGDVIPLREVRYCNGEEVNPLTQWEYNFETKTLLNKQANKCLTVEQNLEMEAKLVGKDCLEQPYQLQRWDFQFL